jgi:hypothetical protein
MGSINHTLASLTDGGRCETARAWDGPAGAAGDARQPAQGEPERTKASPHRPNESLLELHSESCKNRNVKVPRYSDTSDGGHGSCRVQQPLKIPRSTLTNAERRRSKDTGCASRDGAAQLCTLYHGELANYHKKVLRDVSLVHHVTSQFTA